MVWIGGRVTSPEPSLPLFRWFGLVWDLTPGFLVGTWETASLTTNAPIRTTNWREAVWKLMQSVYTLEVASKPPKPF